PHFVHVHDLDSGREETYRRDYRNIDRARFDAWLLGLAKERADFWPGTLFRRLAHESGSLAVCLEREGREERISARVLIGADGAASAVRQKVFPSRAGPRAALAIQVCLAQDCPPGNHEVVFSSRHTDFYAWAIPKPAGVLVGSAFDDARGARDRLRNS
ncbi:MAG: FAD-dependent monooxygenase, partial [Phycisphaerae bacterium]|nr:FAD-dependent monooxygenase [Phycisphaerae bacterium]